MIKGKVMADGKGLAKVVVTDGTAFALTSEDGSYMIDADEKAHFSFCPYCHKQQCGVKNVLFVHCFSLSIICCLN